MTTNTTTAPHRVSPARGKELLDLLVSDHGTALLAYAEKLLSDHHLAEDIVQEALIRAWPHAERLYNTEGSVRGWLLTVTRNLIIDRLRSATARHETVGAADDQDRDVASPDHADAVLTSVQATALLRSLSHEHREVLLHVYLRGRTVQETARILGVPGGTVKSRLHYALKNVRAELPSRPREHAD